MLTFFYKRTCEKNFDSGKLEIEIKNIKDIYLDPEKIQNLLIEKVNIIQNRIEEIINQESENNSEEFKENKIFYSFEKKDDSVAFNILAWIILDDKKNEEKDSNEFIDLLQNTNVVNNKHWLSSKFFGQIKNYIFQVDKKNLQIFLKKVDLEFKKYFDSIVTQIKLIDKFKTENVELTKLKFKLKDSKEDDREKDDRDKFNLINKIRKNKTDNDNDETLKTSMCNFFYLLKDYGRQKILISHYQRGYVWTEKLINDLFYDINNCEKKSYHYLNHILVEKSDFSDYKIYEIIDGQQRIISLLIIYAVCIKFAFLRGIQICTDDSNFFKYPQDHQPKFWYFSDKKNGKILDEILELNFKELSFDKRMNIDKKGTLVSNISKIIELVVSEFYDEEEKFNSFLDNLKYYFIFTITTIYKSKKVNGINAFATFNNLNSKLLPLDSLELLKSYLFLKHKNDPNLNLFLNNQNKGDKLKDIEIIKDEYEKFQENIGKFSDGSYNFTRTVYLGIKDLEKKFQKGVNISAIFDNLKKIVDHIVDHDKSKNKNFLDDLKKMNCYFEKYFELFDPEKLKESEKPWIKDNLDYLMTLSDKSFSSYRPFIYKLFEFINRGNYRTSQELLREILYVLETYILRHKWISTHDASSSVKYWVIELNESENLKDFLYKGLGKLQKNMPTNIDLERELDKENYKLDKNIARLILAKMELVLNDYNLKIWSKNKDQYFWTQEYQIEHIISTKDKFFKNNKLKEQIGNKMLLTSEENKQIGNKSIWLKRKFHNDVGFRYKKLFLSNVDPRLKTSLKEYGFDPTNYEFDNFEKINKDNETNDDIEKSPELKKQIIEDITNVIKDRSTKLLNWIQLIWNEKPIEWIKKLKN